MFVLKQGADCSSGSKKIGGSGQTRRRVYRAVGLNVQGSCVHNHGSARAGRPAQAHERGSQDGRREGAYGARRVHWDGQVDE